MNAAAIIAEYNPFHNGHQYHIEATKKATGADAVVILMSGDYVQRGAPALISKYTRAKQALLCGADAVIMLPVTAVLSSALEYARCGVAIADALNGVSHLSFGCECRNPQEQSLLYKSAQILAAEPPALSAHLRHALKIGYTYPKASAYALSAVMDLTQGEQRLLSAPNNILAISYLRAIAEFASDLNPCMIERTGGGYHAKGDPALDISAGSVRSALFSGDAGISDSIRRSMPEKAWELLKPLQENHLMLNENDFSLLLHTQLLTYQDRLLSDFPNEQQLIRRIIAFIETYPSFSEYAHFVKAKNHTLTSICRLLMRITLGIDETYDKDLKSCMYIPYARVLGFRRKSAGKLDRLLNESRLPVITRAVSGRDLTSPSARRLFRTDLVTSDIYRAVLEDKTNTAFKNDLRQPLIIV